MWRHGDILITSVSEIPAKATRQSGVTLAWGELTGHRHRIEDPTSAELYTFRGESFLRVTAPTARLVHEEHKPITLQAGVYRFWFQREYTPGAIRRIVD